MHRFFRDLLLVALTLFSIRIVSAQADTDCAFNLRDMTDAVRDAESAVSVDDSEAASAALDAAQALLDNYRERCVESLTAEPFTLTETYRAAGGLFSLNYPAEWQVFENDAGLTLFGEASLDLEALSSDPSAVTPGGIVLIAQVVPQSPPAARTAEGFVEEVRAGSNPVFESADLSAEPSVRGLPAARIEALGDEVAASIEIVDLRPANEDGAMTLLFLAAIAVSDEADSTRTLLDAVALTLRSPADDAAAESPSLSPPTAVEVAGIGYDDIGFSRSRALFDLGIPPGRAIALSPDGERLAYLGADGLCIMTLADEESVCTDGPDGYAPLILDWSPDGRYIAGTANFYEQLREPDVILFDTTTQRYDNLTDDGVDRVRFDDNDPGALFDIGVSWANDSQSLYLYRVVPEPGGSISGGTQGIYQLPLDGGDAELLINLTPVLGTVPSVYFMEGASLDGMMPVSPDGTRLAFIVTTPDREVQNGVWVYNLETDDLDPVVPTGRLMADVGEAEASPNSSTPVGLSWSPAGGLYIHSAFAAFQRYSLSYYDFATLTLLTAPAAENAAPRASDNAFAEMPVWAAPLPNRDGVIYATALLEDGVTIHKARVINGVVEAEAVVEITPQPILTGSSLRAGVGANGTLLLGLLILSP